MLHRTQVLAGCTDGPCPRVDATTVPGLRAVQGSRQSPDPGWLAIPGAIPSAAEMAAMTDVPPHETVVLVPEADLRGYAAAGAARPAQEREGSVYVPRSLLAEYAAVAA